MTIDVDAIRQDFPILDQDIFDHPLVYLDNGASSQMPRPVMETLQHYQSCDHSNVHRGAHSLSGRATELYESARERVQSFIKAERKDEIIFTSGTTDSLNKVCQMVQQFDWSAEDEILISVMEHHSNLIPWQQLAKKTGAQIKFIPLNEKQELDLDQALNLVNDRTKLLSISHASNVLGSVNPIKELSQAVHRVGGLVCVDGAQAVPHMAVDVQDLGADFYAFSGHKMCGPTGIGVLYGKKKYLDWFDPVVFGGEMINYVSLEKSLWKDPPYKFEAGTPNIAGAIALAAAIDYLDAIGMDAIRSYEQALISTLLEELQSIEGLSLYGPQDRHTGIISFNIGDIHPHDVATVFDSQGLAIRAGHHCCQPLMSEIGARSTARASFYFYNTKEEAKKLLQVIEKTKEFFNYE